MHLETEGEEEFGEKTGKSVLEDEKGQGGWHTEGREKGGNWKYGRLRRLKHPRKSRK